MKTDVIRANTVKIEVAAYLGDNDRSPLTLQSILRWRQHFVHGATN